MYLAMTMDGKTLKNHVTQRFNSCKYLLVVNTTDFSVTAVRNDKNISEENLAKKVIDSDCEGIITGEMRPVVFNVLADAYITRYSGMGYSGLEALELMQKRELPLIKNLDGTNHCGGDHHEN